MQNRYSTNIDNNIKIFKIIFQSLSNLSDLPNTITKIVLNIKLKLPFWKNTTEEDPLVPAAGSSKTKDWALV